MGIDLMIDRQDTGATDSRCGVTLSALLCGITEIKKADDRLIFDLQLNSRRVTPGDVFIAMPGTTADGRDYIHRAVDNGAAAVLYESSGAFEIEAMKSGAPVIGIKNLKDHLGAIASRRFNNPSRHMRIVGVTGTNGKTTTAYLAGQAMKLLGFVCGYSGTIGTGEIGELEISDLTTADVITMHRRLAHFYSDGVTAVSMEVSSHGLDQGRVNGIEFDTAVFTNLGRDHLDYHGTMEKYGSAKRRLFELPSLETAVVNADDDCGRELIRYCGAQRKDLHCLSYGLSRFGDADLMPERLQVDDRGIRFDLVYKGETASIRTGLLGLVNVPNILAAIGVLTAMQMPIARIAQVAEQLSAPPGRMEIFRNKPHQPAVIVDYAHTPDALERALLSLRSLFPGKLVVVFGCGGDRDRTKRPLMGGIAERLADGVILTDDNPRFESPEFIIGQIQAGMTKPAPVVHDRREAARRAIKNSESGDVVLLAGKGHELTQTVGAEILQLCDREFVPQLLEEMS